MANIWIKPRDVLAVRDRLCKDGRDMDSYNLDSSCWYYNRHVSLSCLRKNHPGLPRQDLRYYFCLDRNWEGSDFVSLQISPGNSNLRPLVKYLHDKTDNHPEVEWLEGNYYCCRLKEPVRSDCFSCLADCFEVLINIFDPLTDSFLTEQEETEKRLAFGEGAKEDLVEVKALSSTIVKVKDLSFKSFRIPEYQRTYRWKTKNVHQLINDIREYAGQSTYRLGSLVLHNSDIVDGQQRIVTLSLILYRMMRNPAIRSHHEYDRLFNEVIGFWGRTSYDSQEALDNIWDNASAILMRQDDLDFEFFKSLVENCEFVVIRLPELHEAFQFFDSQNARGKDLEAHDLLKAFHLREISALDNTDKDNISRWQNIATNDLVSLFLCLFRIRMWSKGESARFFTKSDVDEFKGLSLGKEKDPMPFYKQAVLLNRVFALFSTDDHELTRQNYPFQLSGVVINGSRFFDMILHYEKLYQSILNPGWDQYDESAKDIIKLINDYDGMERTGDEYVRNVFDALMLFYVDKFGSREIGKAAKLFFLYAYSIRLSQFRVSLASIDGKVIRDPLFKIIRDATNPYDVLNYLVPPVDTPAPNRSEKLLQRFESMKMIKYER